MEVMDATGKLRCPRYWPTQSLCQSKTDAKSRSKYKTDAKSMSKCEEPGSVVKRRMGVDVVEGRIEEGCL